MKGIPTTVIVDDFLPFNSTFSSSLAFAIQDSITAAIWTPVLEKMWAKTNCNYELITSGSPVEVYDWLLGAPVEQLWMEADMGYEGTEGTVATAATNVWNTLTAALDNGYLVGVGTDDVTSFDLVPSHSWSVVDYYTIND